MTGPATRVGRRGPAGGARRRSGVRSAAATALSALIVALASSDAREARAADASAPTAGRGGRGRSASRSEIAPPKSSGLYPPSAAGWGPETGDGRFVSRWVEDWTGRREAGTAPPLKAMPLWGGARLTLSAETRLRYDSHRSSSSDAGGEVRQGLFRGVVGADLRLHPSVRLFGEIGTGQVTERRWAAAASLQNNASLQQLFVDVRAPAGAMLLGAMVGRQEFSDGPRQLLSVGDGPNVHRTWNGVRVYAHARRFRLGTFDLKVTRPGRGPFDEEVDGDERIRGLNGSFIVRGGAGRSDVYLDPFWIHSENASYRSGGRVGRDDRDTWGARLWGRSGDWSFDVTLARQSGRFMEREIDAWGAFAVLGVSLGDADWKPRLGAHVDLASGGGAYGSGTLEEFNPLYASSGHLGEGRFLSTSNLLLVAPGITVSPTPATRLAVEYGFAWRLAEHDAAYAGGMRAYPGTEKVPGRGIGGLLRVSATWTVADGLTLSCGYERLAAGEALERARLPSGAYGYAGATYRY